ncbi:ribose 5-phosphate isomerase B [Candidatus Peregrinibacteria bacterium]|nr:ribose 5-phosphate isomerase B [Candidatus Peregrinibacteria bacterium]
MIGEKKKKLVFIGADHAGFKAKEDLKAYLQQKGFEVTDLGCFTEESCDYPDVAREVGEKVVEHPESFGVLICGTGIGVAMAVNKFKDIRAVNAVTAEMAEMARKHNNANVLTMGARLTDIDAMKKIADKFFETDFENGEERHVRRVEKLSHIG